MSNDALVAAVARLLMARPPAIPRTDDFVVVSVDSRQSHTGLNFDEVVPAELAARYQARRWHPDDL